MSKCVICEKSITLDDSFSAWPVKNGLVCEECFEKEIIPIRVDPKQLTKAPLFDGMIKEDWT